MWFRNEIMQRESFRIVIMQEESVYDLRQWHEVSGSATRAGWWKVSPATLKVCEYDCLPLWQKFS